MAETYGEIIQEFHRTNEEKRTGRVFGYILAHREIMNEQGEVVQYAAWVQRGVTCKKEGFKEFGATQDAHRFATMADARAWQRATLAKRTAK